MRHVVMFSGGAGSWAAAKRVVERYGLADVVLLFTDTRIEDEDNYRFIKEAAENVGAPLVTITEGRSPWEVFKDRRFLGNSRIDPCSEALKRKPADAWLTANCDPQQTVCYVGIDWSESHRFERLEIRKRERGWTFKAPLCEPPYLSRSHVFDWLTREGIKRPRLYDMGFAHANCGGFCCKAGQGHFANLLKAMPDRYAEHEAKEEEFRQFIGSDVAMMKEQRNGESKPLTMRTLRERIEGNPEQVDMFDIGGCGCFLTEETT